MCPLSDLDPLQNLMGSPLAHVKHSFTKLHINPTKSIFTDNPKNPQNISTKIIVKLSMEETLELQCRWVINNVVGLSPIYSAVSNSLPRQLNLAPATHMKAG